MVKSDVGQVTGCGVQVITIQAPTFVRGEAGEASCCDNCTAGRRQNDDGVGTTAELGVVLAHAGLSPYFYVEVISAETALGREWRTTDECGRADRRLWRTGSSTR